MTEDTEPVLVMGTDSVRPLVFTPETLRTFWEKAKQFPTVYGQEIVDDWGKFAELIFDIAPDGGMLPKGLFWVYKDGDNDFTGVVFLTNMTLVEGQPIDAQIHYSFFDRKHHGRVPLVKAMLKFLFEKYGFVRLSATIPNYTTSQARHFAQEVGFSYEGKRRNAAKYKGEWFAVNLYGILRSEALKFSGIDNNERSISQADRQLRDTDSERIHTFAE